MIEKINIENLPYRKCVGMMLLNDKNEIFIGKRIDNRVGGWQMPQGGIDDNEDPEQAVIRELQEEIGTDKVEILTRTKNSHYYDLPEILVPKLWSGKYRGQQQVWFALRFLGNEADINLNYHHVAEFSEWKWANREEVVSLVVDFKRDLYREVMKELIS